MAGPVATNQPAEANTALQRRAVLRDALVAAAERTIEREGLRGLHARSLAKDVGCAVGAIYNAVADLDELILLVNARTLSALEHELSVAVSAGETKAADTKASDAAIGRLVRMALAYLDFAAGNTQRWRALFDHRLSPGQDIPDWYRKEQQRLFDYVEDLLVELQGQESRVRRALLARSLFSAVHGLVVLGLEEKLQTIPLPVLREQIRFVVTAIGRGMLSNA
jgi:AcrR family transcriptional regulator